jgi:hypothetical protein
VLFQATANIAGHPALMLLDTGANRSRLDEHSAIASVVDRIADATGTTDMGVTGAAAPATLAHHVQFSLGGRRQVIDLRIGPASSSCSRDGVIGMDLMSTCLLVLSRHRLAATCAPN